MKNQAYIGRMIILLLALTAIVIQVEAQGSLLSFPSADGFGKYTTGGRGGQVIYVTNLNDDSNPGSLRYAVSQLGARYVLFKVSGTIQLKSALKITQGDLTIAGQTAPGDGICLRDYPVEIQADNVIVRYLRFRMGDETAQEADAFWGRNHRNIIIDHCSMSWSTDECSSFYDNENFTMQWCFIAESLRNSVHGKGAHGYGGIWGGKNASFHHNLLANHDSRNPRFCGSRYSNQPDKELVDFRNNVLYNWGSNSSYAGEGGSYNMVNNYYKAGPATSSSSNSRIMQPYADSGGNSQPAGVYGIFYVAGNTVTASPAVTTNNWLGVSLHSTFATYAPAVTINDIKSDTEFAAQMSATQTAADAYAKVLEFGGACLVRDTVDKRIAHDTETGTATVTNGGNGSTNGIVDTQSAVGGWPVLQSAPAPADSDNDGMPDAWEDAKSLAKNNPADAKLTTLDGIYPNLEVYLNGLVASITEGQSGQGNPTAINSIKKTNGALTCYFSSSTKELVISHSETIQIIQVYSLSGQLVYSASANQNELRLKLPLKQGMYLVRVQDELNGVYAEKIWIN